jgi:maltooligosyltrehalose synthase
VRRDAQDLFLEGDYLPLATETPVEGQAIAFARTIARGPQEGASKPSVAIAIAPHLVARMIAPDRPVPLGDAWKTARVLLPAALASLTYVDAFTGAELRPVRGEESAWLFVGQALRALPVALLTSPSTPNSATPNSQ